MTGGIGAGKSTALALLEGLGAATLSTDRIVHELYAEPAVRDAVVERWGPEVAPGGTVDRAAVAREAFADSQERRWLEGLLWPLVAERMAQWRAGLEARRPRPPAGVIEVPLLFESGLEGGFDATIAVVADESSRRARAGSRDHAALDERTARQLGQDEKAARARRPAISRRTRVRRRRALIALALAAGVAAAAALLAPLFDTAVKELTLPLRHEDVIRQQASEKGLDPALIAGVIYAESKFADRTSSAGAEGLMQILPDTARFIARRSGGTRFRTADLGDPEVNIRYGSYYLRYLLDRHAGSTVLALASYNAGETNVARWIARARAAGREFTVDDIPFPETRAYVERVLGARDDYRREYASELGLG